MLPTKNEISGLRQVLPRIDRALFHEIILADAGSTDGSVEFARQHGLRVVIQPGVGLPDAEEAAFREFTGDIFVLFTPDGNSLPELLKPLVDKIVEGYDMVVVSRYLDGAKSYDDDGLTSLGNVVFTKIVNVLFWTRYTDVLVGFRAWTRDAIEKMGLMGHTREGWLRRKFFYMNSWELGSCMRSRRAGLRAAEIPGDEPKRVGGVRKLSIVRNGTGGLLQVLWDFLTFWPKKTICHNMPVSETRVA